MQSGLLWEETDTFRGSRRHIFQPTEAVWMRGEYGSLLEHIYTSLCGKGPGSVSLSGHPFSLPGRPPRRVHGNHMIRACRECSELVNLAVDRGDLGEWAARMSEVAS